MTREEAATAAGEKDLTRYETFRYTRGGGLYEPEIDPNRCRASVHEPGRSVRSYQCRFKATFPTNPGGPEEWCKLHAPAKRAEKQAAAEATYQAERARAWRYERIRALAAEAADLLVEGRTAEAGEKAMERARLKAESAEEARR